MRLFPYWAVDGATRPLGMPMCQNRLAVPTWSYAMEILPPRQIVEIGSYNGAFATALGLHARAIGARITTYDINPPSEDIAPIGALLGVTFITADVWTQVDQIAQIIRSPGTSYVLCDGGDKPRELDTFARVCKPGDVIAAHDYDAVGERELEGQGPAIPSADRPWPWCEMRKRTGDAIAARQGLVPWLQVHFDLAGWLVFRKGG